MSSHQGIIANPIHDKALMALYLLHQAFVLKELCFYQAVSVRELRRSWSWKISSSVESRRGCEPRSIRIRLPSMSCLMSILFWQRLHQGRNEAENEGRKIITFSGPV